MSAADALSSVLSPEALVTETGAEPTLGRPPEAVVRPGSTEEVATLMEWATREGVGVLPMASGRRVAGVGRDGRYVALVTERVAGIQEYEAADLTLTAGAGTRFSTIAEALAEHGQWAPFDPPHVSARSLGGLLATGDSGPLATGYGHLRNHALGATVVTGDGRVLRLGGKVVKNVAGFDVLKAVVGSRGTLAVITSATVRAFPAPQVDRALGLRADSVRDLLDVALEVGTAPILPASCVVVDGSPAYGRAATDGRAATAGRAATDGRARLVVRLHGARETVDADQRSLEGHLGVELRTVDEDASTVRDHAADHDIVVVASARPSRLGGLIEAVEALRPEAVFLDSYAGSLRAGLSDASPESLEDLRTRFEKEGGALSIRSRRVDPAVGAASSRPTAGEERLVRRLRAAFDPGEVLWPTRR